MALRLAPRVGRRTLSGLTSTSECPGEARCLTPSRSSQQQVQPVHRGLRTILEEAAVAGQRERDAVVAGPLRNLTDVTARRTDRATGTVRLEREVFGS